MIVDVTEKTLTQIENPALRSYAEMYVSIYQDFLKQIAQTTGIEFEQDDTTARMFERIETLRKRGAQVRNDRKSVVVNSISPACIACQRGTGSATFFISLKCHRDCFYCFNPNQEGYEYYREHHRDTVAELQELRASRAKVRHLALTGGEPLLHKEETIRFFQEAHRNFPGVYTRLYTCGDHADSETLRALRDAHLDEIRFSIRMQDPAKGRHHTLERIALAREYIPYVMVEMPVLPDTREEMKEVLLELDRLGIFGINLLEFCFPLRNTETYRQRGYKIKARPYRVLYNYWYAGGLPVAGSEDACLDLIEFVLERRLKLGVHYCSLENKHTGQIYQQNTRHRKPKNLFFSQKDYFLKSAKVFGEDIPVAVSMFKQRGFHEYQYNTDYDYLEFHVNQIQMLKPLKIEIGISSCVFEERAGDLYLRELKLDLTTPQMFRLSDL